MSTRDMRPKIAKAIESVKGSVGQTDVIMAQIERADYRMNAVTSAKATRTGRSTITLDLTGTAEHYAALGYDLEVQVEMRVAGETGVTMRVTMSGEVVYVHSNLAK